MEKVTENRENSRVERYMICVVHVECVRHIQNLLGEESVHTGLPGLPIKVKFTPEQATKAQMGSSAITLLFL
jgi:hypothetical protein